MRSRWIAAGLNLLTVAGGHFYNNRPNKAALFVILALFMPWLTHFIVINAFEYGVSASIAVAMTRSASIVLTAILATAVISAIIADVDAGRLHEKEGAVTRISAAVVGSLAGFAFLTGAFISFNSALNFYSDTPTASAIRSNAGEGPFERHVVEEAHEFCLSRGCGIEAIGGELGEGEAEIGGFLRLGDAPVEGASVTLLTADGRISETSVTDASGRYRIPVPAGSHDFIKASIEAAVVSGLWRYSLVTGQEGHLAADTMSMGYDYMPPQPLRFDVEKGESARLDLTLHRSPRLRAPAYTGREEVSANEIRLEWTPVAAAEKYVAVISRVTNEGGGVTSHRPIQHLVSETHAVDLAPVLKPLGDSRPADGYSVSIMAFDASGQFIAASKPSNEQFPLPAGWQVKERCRSTFKPACVD